MWPFFQSQRDVSCIRECVTCVTLLTSFTPLLPSQPQVIAKVAASLGPEVHPLGSLLCPGDVGRCLCAREWGKVRPAPRVVRGLQGASFILHSSDLGLGTNSVLTTQGKGLNHTLVTSGVCGMCEVLSLVFPFKKKTNPLLRSFRMVFNQFGFPGQQHGKEKS